MSFLNGGANKGLDRPLPAGYFPLYWQGGFRPLPGVGDVDLLGCEGQPCGFLLKFSDVRLLIRQQMVTAVKEALDAAGVESGLYSFRIGAATTASARGLEDSTVRTLGQWRSLAYLEYIRIPQGLLANYTARLCSAHACGHITIAYHVCSLVLILLCPPFVL